VTSMAKDEVSPAASVTDVGPRPAEWSLESRGVRKSFGEAPVLRGVSLVAAPGEVVAITGESGSGKSSLLLCLSAVLEVDEGSVIFRGQDLATLDRRARIALRRTMFGLVFQGGLLVPELEAIDNVALPLMLSGMDRPLARSRAAAVLDSLDMGDLANRRPEQMSGGEGQRVAIARALVHDPQVLFADEPTGSLDSRNGEVALRLLIDQVRLRGCTLLLVTHSRHVANVADREVVMRDGAIVGVRE